VSRHQEKRVKAKINSIFSISAEELREVSALSRSKSRGKSSKQSARRDGQRKISSSKTTSNLTSSCLNTSTVNTSRVSKKVKNLVMQFAKNNKHSSGEISLKKHKQKNYKTMVNQRLKHV